MEHDHDHDHLPIPQDTLGRQDVRQNPRPPGVPHVGVTPDQVLAKLSPEGRLHWQIALQEAVIEDLGRQVALLEAAATGDGQD